MELQDSQQNNAGLEFILNVNTHRCTEGQEGVITVHICMSYISCVSDGAVLDFTFSECSARITDSWRQLRQRELREKIQRYSECK